LNSFNNESSTDEVAEEKECIDCNNFFTITQGEVNYFIQHSLTAPKRCKPCRATRKSNNLTRTPEIHRPPPSTERVNITCTHCGRNAEVPFKPFPDSPVYCKICWVGIKNIGTPVTYNLPKQTYD
jgi:CxxC-x17-CxxC domain-containing protein